jgi:hypothetical protein
MIEILHFKVGEKIIKLNATVTNLNVWGNLLCHCGRDKNTKKKTLDWLTFKNYILPTRCIMGFI